jgi:SAM-dependent methyltransferase
MLVGQVRALLRIPHKLAMLQLQRLARAQAELLHTNALLESGVARALRDWCSLDELTTSLGSTRPDYLAHVVNLGVTLGSIEARGERFRVKSRVMKAVTAADGEPVAAFLREFAHYHGRLLRELPGQIAGSPPPDYLAEYGDLVAAASRIVEGVLEPFLDDLAGGADSMRILEIGCGSGAYLRRYAHCNAEHSGIAIDYDPVVAEQAKKNVDRWGLSDRFEVHHADVRSPGPELDGPFDLVTSFQNVYYFTEVERAQLFRDIHERLAPGGRLALVSAMSSEGFLFRYYDVLLNGTAGCHSMPTLAAVQKDLEAAGFECIDRVRLLSGPGAAGLVAHRSRAAAP